MQKAYSKTTIYRVARGNYDILKRYCSILLQEGYWDQPEKVLKKSIHEILDLYIQSVLINMALNCNSNSNSNSNCDCNCTYEEQREFIASITDNNMFGVEKGMDLSLEFREEATQHFLSPPILLQLCGLRDVEKQSSLTGLFFDAILNIAMAFAYLSQIQDSRMMQYIQLYFKKIQVFLLNQKNLASAVDEKYIFRKLCNGEWESSDVKLMEAGEDFSEYKRKTLYYIERPLEPVESSLLVEREKDKSNKGSRNLSNREIKDKEIKDKEIKDKEIKDKEIKDNPLGDKIANKVTINGETTKDSTDIDDEVLALQIQEERKKLRLEHLLQELNSLIGLTEVKNEVMSLINLIKVKKLRERYHLPNMDMSFHMVFTGNPGTGKTTVARLIADIYKELGLLSEGHLVETDRSSLVAGYVGQTAIKVKEVIERAIGGILFIDEAYSLTNGIGTNDFGSEAIDTLVKMMEDHREDLVVIVAGYTKEMEQFLKANTGLISRFNRYIRFADYSEEELVEILISMAKKSGFEFEEAAIERVYDYILRMSSEDKMNFGNARGMRNMFESLVVNQANRIVLYDEPSKEQLTNIVEEDVCSFLNL